MSEKFYFDTCIWLNILKRETNTIQGIPNWKASLTLAENILSSEKSRLFYSGIILKEIRSKLFQAGMSECFMDFENILHQEKNAIFVKLTPADYELARNIEAQEAQSNLSFFDCVHIALCKRNNFFLITRDNELLLLSKKHSVTSARPEELIFCHKN